MDKTDIILSLEACQACNGYECRNQCKYYDENEEYPTCTCRLAHDALELIREYTDAASNGKWQPMTKAEARAWLLTNKYERPPIYEEIYPDLAMGPESWLVPIDIYLDKPCEEVLKGYGEVFRWWNFTPENYYDIINDTEWN